MLWPQIIRHNAVRLEKWLRPQFLRLEAESIRTTKGEQTEDNTICFLNFTCCPPARLSPVFLSPAISLSSFPVFLFPTPFLFNLYRHTLAGTLTQYAVYTLSGGFKILVLSPRSLIHTRSPSTFAHYLVLISLPLSGIILIPLFSHLLLIGTQLGEVFNKQQRFTWFLRRLLTHLACLSVMNKQCRSGALFSVCLCCVSSSL